MLKFPATKRFLVKLEFLLDIALITSVFCLIFTLAHRAIFDLDIWLHLRTGQFIAQNKIVPSADIFSFTIPGKPWVDHSWLFQLLSYLIHSAWGLEGLISLECLVILLSFLVLFLIGFGLVRSYLEVAIFIMIAAYASISRFNIRPDIFSLLFFALYLYFLRLHIDKRRIFCLVPIQVFWANLHGYFFLGPLLVLFFIIAEFLRRKLKFLPRWWQEGFALSDSSYRRLIQLFVFVSLACFLNPAGFRGAFYPLYIFKDVLSGKVQVFLQYVQELKPTFSLDLGSPYYTIMFFCFALMAINFKRLKIIEIILVLFFFLFSFSLRNIGFFVFTCYTVIVSYLGQALKKITAHIKLQKPSRQALYFLFRCTALILLIFLLVSRVNNMLGSSYYDFEAKEFKSRLIDIDYRNYPKGAVDFVLENNIPQDMFNDFNSGAYLIGRTYPKRKVFIDGRTELYGPEFFQQYMDSLKGNISSFERIVDKYQIKAILVSMALSGVSDIVGYLYKTPQWKLVFFDQAGVIFLKDVPENQELIKRYRIDLSKYSAPRADLKGLRLKMVYPEPYIKRASLFNLLKEDELVILECKEALRIMPNCAKGYHLMGKTYLRKTLYQDALDNLRSALILSPGNVEALLDLATCYSELEENKLSINALKKAMRLHRGYAPAYYRLGCVYLTMNNPGKAIPVLNKAARYEPKNPGYHFKLAVALYESGRRLRSDSVITKAKLELSEARQLNKQYRDKALEEEIEKFLLQFKRVCDKKER